jgi:hypothetical protein
MHEPNAPANKIIVHVFMAIFDGSLGRSPKDSKIRNPWTAARVGKAIRARVLSLNEHDAREDLVGVHAVGQGAVIRHGLCCQHGWFLTRGHQGSRTVIPAGALAVTVSVV